jgi:predicted kinase
MIALDSSSAPFLLVLGGAPGAGKTTLSRRLAADYRLPRLGADAIGRTIRSSQALTDPAIDAQWIAHDVLFQLGEELLQAGVSAILDINLGWAFQWAWLDRLRARYPAARILPIVLRCPRDICLARISARHASDPAYEDAPQEFITNPLILRVWAFLDQLDRPDIHVVDASGDHETVYAAAIEYLQTYLIASQ